MGQLHRSAASLSFFGDDLDPDELTARLGGQPTVGVRKGATWRTASGRELPARTGSWRVQTVPRQPGNLDGQINELLDALNDDLSVWRDLTARYDSRIFCGLFLAEGNEGFGLKAETVKRLGDRGLRVDFDLYGADMPD